MSLSGPCECCPNDKGPFVKFMTMIMCMDCYNKEKALQAANNHPVTQQNRVNEYRELSNITVAISRETDAALQVRTDLFNASTTSILELKKLIDEDETITNKPYALASELKNRFNHFKDSFCCVNCSLNCLLCPLGMLNDFHPLSFISFPR